MPRWKLTIEYDGTRFVGWQIQDEGFSVQQVLEEAIFKLTGVETRLTGAGRTDSGVHACGQVAHFDMEKSYSSSVIRNALNVYARPHAVSILKAEKVTDDFHARFHAINRVYRYVICNRPAPVMIGANYMWHIARPLDIDAMRKASKYLLGLHDFSSFRAIRCQAKHALRSIDSLEIITEGDYIYIDIEAKSFLHHQVRNIVGTLKKIGEGKWPPEIMPEILAAKDRTKAGMTAPPQGLFFVRVDYPETGSK